MTLTAQGGVYTAPVSLACTNLPAAGHCTFEPASVDAGREIRAVQADHLDRDQSRTVPTAVRSTCRLIQCRRM